MKKIILAILCLTLCISVSAQSEKTIKLNPPSAEIGADVMSAFKNRKSDRLFSKDELTIQQLSDLLWSANGFNRTDKRTAATAMNRQEIELYVCMESGAYYYDAKAHTLTLVNTKDLRSIVAGKQDFAKAAPISLIIVADIIVVDMDKFGRKGEEAIRATAYDAGIVSQNIYLYCAGEGLATVVRMGMDKEGLMKELKLQETHFIHLNQQVGLFAE